MTRLLTLAIFASFVPAMVVDDDTVSTTTIQQTLARLSKKIESLDDKFAKIAPGSNSPHSDSHIEWKASPSAVGQKNDNSKRDEIVVGEPLEYSIIIREKIGDVSHEHVMARMHGSSRVEAFAGLPMTDKEPKVGSPNRAFVTAKVISEKDGVAEVRCTIGQTIDFKNENGSTTWTEKKLASNRTIRFGEIITMDLPRSNPESPAYECSITISRHSR